MDSSLFKENKLKLKNPNQAKLCTLDAFFFNKNDKNENNINYKENFDCKEDNKKDNKAKSSNETKGNEGKNSGLDENVDYVNNDISNYNNNNRNNNNKDNINSNKYTSENTTNPKQNNNNTTNIITNTPKSPSTTPRKLTSSAAETPSKSAKISPGSQIILPSDSESEQEKSSANSSFLNKKRLVRKCEKIKERKKLKKIAHYFIDNEAELGSDNEEHDDVVKKRYNNADSDEEKEFDERAEDVENLINNEETDEFLQKEKYFEDEEERDRKEIIEVIKGPKRRIVYENKGTTSIKIDEKGLSLKVRMERMNTQNIIDTEEEGKFRSVEENIRKFRKQFRGEGGEEDENLADLKLEETNKILKEIENEKINKENFRRILRENDVVLKNVKNLNNDGLDMKESKGVFVKGNQSITNKKPKFRPFLLDINSKLRPKNNSILNEVKKSGEESRSSSSNLQLNSKNSFIIKSSLSQGLISMFAK